MTKGPISPESRCQLGIDWLNKHAPMNWIENLFVVRETDQRLEYIGDESSQNACVLALAFKESKDSKIERFIGHISFNAIRKRFNLSRKECHKMGFCDLPSSEHLADMNNVWRNLLQTLYVPKQEGARSGNYPKAPTGEEMGL